MCRGCRCTVVSDSSHEMSEINSHHSDYLLAASMCDSDVFFRKASHTGAEVMGWLALGIMSDVKQELSARCEATAAGESQRKSLQVELDRLQVEMQGGRMRVESLQVEL